MAEVRPQLTIAERWGKIFLSIVLLVWCGGLVIGFNASLTILTAVAFLAALAGFRWPVIGLFGVGILCTVDAVTRSLLLGGGLLRWNTMNYLLLCFMIFHIRSLFNLRGAIVRLFQLFIGILALGLLVTPSLQEGIQELLNIIPTFGLIILFALSSSDREVWFWMPVVNAVVAAVGSLLFFVQQSSLPVVNYNAWALFPLAGLFSIAMAFRFPLTRRRQGILGILGLIDALCVFLSSSRGGLLVAVVCLLFIVLMFRTTVQRMTYVAASAFVALILLGAFSDLDQNALHRVGKLFDTSQSMRSRTSGRSELALGGWYIFRAHPLGVGTGGYSIAWSRLGFEEGLTSEFSYGELRSAHSGWIKTLAENGVPGAVLLLSFVCSFTVIGLLRKRRECVLLGLLVTCALGLTLISTEYQSKALWFLASGGTVLLYMRSEPLRAGGKRDHLPVSRLRVALQEGRHG